MSAAIMDLTERLTPLGKRRAHLLGCKPLDMAQLIEDLTRFEEWATKHDIRVLRTRCDNHYGSTVTLINGRRAHALLGGKAIYRGHDYTGQGRVEQWEARIPNSTVLLQWVEEASA